MQGDDLPQGCAGLFDGNGGVRGAAAWRWHEICGNCEIYERGMGAPRYTPRVCLAAVWYGSGDDLPLG